MRNSDSDSGTDF